jgi:CHAD domain-containing protein
MAKAKKIDGVDCTTPASEAIRPVLITRLDEMCSLRDRALDWSDPEGVHDMRVSSRRLRGALRDFGPYLSRRRLVGPLKQIKVVADALGGVRDQDVAIIGLQKLSSIAPGEAAATLGEFVSSRDAIRKKARRNLQHTLSKTALKRMQTDFADAIEAATAKSRKRRSKGAKGSPEITYAEIAKTIVGDRLREMEKLSNGFYHPLKIAPLHQLRIAAKRLRYALELFEQCLGPGSAVFAKRVTGLQSSLGELHDSDIWIENFGESLSLERQERAKDSSSGSLWLLSHFVKLHSKHLRNALARWQEWETSGSSYELRQLLK